MVKVIEAVVESPEIVTVAGRVNWKSHVAVGPDMLHPEENPGYAAERSI